MLRAKRGDGITDRFVTVIRQIPDGFVLEPEAIEELQERLASWAIADY